MSLLERMQKERVHSRNIEIFTCLCSGEGIIVQGSLKDDRLQQHYNIEGRLMEPFTVHHMIIRMLVSDKLVIEEIEAEMPGVPREECPETIKSLEKIKGWKIAPGFTERIKAEIGGTAGCAHLSTLLLAMAPAAVQGSWSCRSLQPINPADKSFSPRLMEQYLIDTCWVWRRDGDRAKELLKMMEKENM
jgi:DUF2889 family protein